MKTGCDGSLGERDANHTLVEQKGKRWKGAKVFNVWGIAGHAEKGDLTMFGAKVASFLCVIF